jgi:hypothetical protein
MGLFDKKFCDVCGNKIGLLGNRKLEDGNLCKDCAAKLSPFFNDRRNSTVAEIKQQLAYREENEKKLQSFNPTQCIGGGQKVFIDEKAQTFVVTNYSDWRGHNPDLINFSQVLSCKGDIDEHKTELYDKDSEGKTIPYNPRRYRVDYSFTVRLQVNSPWFSEIEVDITDGDLPDSPYTDAYRSYEREMHALCDILNNKTAPAAQPAQPVSWTCSCGTTNTGNFCSSCGKPRQ